jgi:hypothetical protein
VIEEASSDGGCRVREFGEILCVVLLGTRRKSVEANYVCKEGIERAGTDRFEEVRPLGYCCASSADHPPRLPIKLYLSIG